MEKSNKSNTLKKQLLESLELALGVVTTACKNAKIDRSTFYDWTNPESKRYDKDFTDKVEDIKNVALDFVESQLFQKIQGVKATVDGKSVFKKEPDTTAIIFYLKTKGKHRGFIEKSEIDHTTKGESINETRKLVFRKKGVKNTDNEN